MGKHGKTWENMRKHGKKRNFEKKKFWIRRLNRTRSRHPHVCFLFKSTVCSYSFVLPHFVCRDFMLFKTIYSYDIIWYELHEIEIFDILWLIIPYAYAKLTYPQYRHGEWWHVSTKYILTSYIVFLTYPPSCPFAALGFSSSWTWSTPLHREGHWHRCYWLVLGIGMGSVATL